MLMNLFATIIAILTVTEFPIICAFVLRERGCNHPTHTRCNDRNRLSHLYYSSSNTLRSESLLEEEGKPVAVESVTLRNSNLDATKRYGEAGVATRIINSKRWELARKRREHKTDDNRNQKLHEFLKSELGLPVGLRDTLLRHMEEDSLKKIWVVDNSGSMKYEDGRCILSISSLESKSTGDTSKQKSNGEYNDCTRWAEARETVNCHAQLNSVLGLPTEFQLLNKRPGLPNKARVGYRKKTSSIPNGINNGNNNSIFRNRHKESDRVRSIMIKNEPKGKTPLYQAIHDVKKEVVRMLPTLLRDGTMVTVVICTDGVTNSISSGCNNPADGSRTDLQELEDALRSLSGLPVVVVIRLCTSYGQDIEFYYGLDERMTTWNSISEDKDEYTNNVDVDLPFYNNRSNQLRLDVIDDYESEAKLVYKHNPWLNYPLVLHRLREMGLQGSSELFDLLNQRPFSQYEIRSFCALLFGTADDLLNDPFYDGENFVAQIEHLQQKENHQHWNPIKNCILPWIDTDELLQLIQCKNK